MIQRILGSRIAIGVASALIATGAVSVGSAFASHDTNTIHACKSAGGTLRLVEASSDCTNKELALEWNIQGPQGPQGEAGMPGISPAAGTSCPEGEFVTGIATDGTLVCGAVGNDGVGGGDATDADGDGFTTAAGDCDDGEPAMNPGAVEVADGLDNDCDGDIDEGTTVDCNDGDPYTTESYDAATGSCMYLPLSGADFDNDGFVASQVGGDDCNDGDPAINPGAPEVADGVDNDCDGTVDEGTITTTALNETDQPAEADACVVQFPISISASPGQSVSVYGQVYEAGVTEEPGPSPALSGEVGYGPAGTDPRSASGWVFSSASYNIQDGNDDEYVATIVAPAVDSPATYSYVYRFSFDGGNTATYCDVDWAGSNSGLTFDLAAMGTMEVQ